MTILVTEREPIAVSVEVTDDYLTVVLDDGRRVSNPIGWYPRLAHGTTTERSNYELYDGEVIRWPDLDEDLSVESIVAGRRSGERQEHFERWLEKRKSATSRQK